MSTTTTPEEEARLRAIESGGADPLGRGDPTPVVRPGHRPHHPRPAGALLLDHLGRPRVAKTAPYDPTPGGRLVRQAAAHLRGRHRPGATPSVAGVRRFFTVRSQPRYAGTPRRPVPPACRFPRLRRLKCVKLSCHPARARKLLGNGRAVPHQRNLRHRPAGPHPEPSQKRKTSRYDWTKASKPAASPSPPTTEKDSAPS